MEGGQDIASPVAGTLSWFGITVSDYKIHTFQVGHIRESLTLAFGRFHYCFGLLTLTMHVAKQYSHYKIPRF